MLMNSIVAKILPFAIAASALAASLPAAASTPITYDYRYQSWIGVPSNAGSASLGNDSGSYTSDINLASRVYYVGESSAYIKSITITSFSSTSPADKLYLDSSSYSYSTSAGFGVPPNPGQVLATQISASDAPYTFTLLPGTHSFIFTVASHDSVNSSGNAAISFTVNTSVSAATNPTSAVPETSTYTMLLGGLAVIACAAWCRRRKGYKGMPSSSALLAA